MSEIWDRDFTDICTDARRLFNAESTWADLFPIVVQKWNPLRVLNDVKYAMLRQHLRVRIEGNLIARIYDNDTCAFCRKAVFLTKRRDFGVDGVTCRACILRGRCYRPLWWIQRFHRRLEAGRYAEAKDALLEGILECSQIIQGKLDPDDDREGKEIA